MPALSSIIPVVGQDYVTGPPSERPRTSWSPRLPPLRVLHVIPGDPQGGAMIFAKRQVSSLARAGVAGSCFREKGFGNGFSSLGLGNRAPDDEGIRRQGRADRNPPSIASSQPRKWRKRSDEA